MKASVRSLVVSMTLTAGAFACNDVLGIHELTDDGGAAGDASAADVTVDHPADAVVASDAPGDVDAGPFCGDGVKNGAEPCDGADLGGQTCASRVARGWVGALKCTSSCTFDTSSCTTPATTYNDLTDASKWATFDIGTVTSGAYDFAGGAFDGRYLYFASAGSLYVARYDTTAPFTDISSWTTFDVSTVGSNVRSIGAAFDGRYVYLVPYNTANGPSSGVVTRYDTTAPFTTKSSWETFDVATVDARAQGFAGAVFDGRYLNLVPHYAGGAPSSVTARYDTTAAFGSGSSWQTFDLSTLGADLAGFTGGAFDGTHVYLSPASFNRVARLDPMQDLDAGAAWSTFDIGSLGTNGMYGTIFDGRYVNFVPYWPNPLAMARYDTTAGFGTSGAWSKFSMLAVDAGTTSDGGTATLNAFIGGTFDGRYLYLAPSGNITGSNGLTARCDPSSFNAASCTAFDIRTLDARAFDFSGALFDGRSVYYVPAYQGGSGHALVARFEAKSVSWLPKGWNASFY